MTLSTTKNKYFGTFDFYKKCLTIALPMMAQLLIQNLVSLIDNFMVAGLGDIKMSGVNVAGQILFVFMVFINTICASGGIFMSQYKGAKDTGGMQQVFRYKIIICVLSGLGFTFLCLLNPRPILSLMVHGNTSKNEILLSAVEYAKVASFTCLPFVISASISSSLREIGEVKVPLYVSIIATAINTLFNWILIYGNLGAPRLEIKGAAIATVIARTTEMIIFIVYIIIKKPPFYVKFVDLLKVRLQLFGTILGKSVMILVSELSWVLSETVTTALYNSRGGAEVVAGMSAGFAIANLFFISCNGIVTATGVIMGTTLGAGNLEEARRQKNWILNGSAIFGILFLLLGYLSVSLVPIVFVNLSVASHEVTRGLIFVVATYMPLWCYLNAQFAISRTGGDTTLGVLADLITNGLFVVPGMFIMTYLTTLSPVAMYAIIKLSDGIKFTIATIWLKKERWLKNLAIENAVSAQKE